jgi:hypothetical protein
MIADLELIKYPSKFWLPKEIWLKIRSILFWDKVWCLERNLPQMGRRSWAAIHGQFWDVYAGPHYWNIEYEYTDFRLQTFKLKIVEHSVLSLKQLVDGDWRHVSQGVYAFEEDEFFYNYIR